MPPTEDLSASVEDPDNQSRWFPLFKASASRYLGWLKPPRTLDSAHSVQCMQTGTINTVVKICLKDGSVKILRIMPRGLDVLQAECAALQWARSQCIPVSGVDQIVSESEECPHPFWVGSWMHGVEVAEEPPVDQMGELLWKLSQVRFSRPGKLNGQGEVRKSRVPTLKHQLSRWLKEDKPQERLGKGLLGEARQFLEQVEPVHLEFTPRLVHGDLRREHLLFQDATLSGVLDWEWAHAGDACKDWVQVTRHRTSGWIAKLEQDFRNRGGIPPSAVQQKVWRLSMALETSKINAGGPTHWALAKREIEALLS